MNDEKTITQRDIDDATVRLKPLFGVQPGRYLAALYAALLLLLLFLILVYPGLSHPGTLYSVKADPPGSAIFIDGVYAGFAPRDVFVPAGAHQLSLGRPGFATHSEDLQVKGRVFASLFFKPRAAFVASLSPLRAYDAYDQMAAGIADFAAWALVGTPSEAYQVPLPLSDAAVAASIAPDQLASSAGLAGAALSYASNAQSVRDAARAVCIAYGGSATVSPVSMGALVGRLSSEIAADPAMLIAFASSVPPGLRDRITASDLYKRAIADIEASAAASAPARVLGTASRAGFSMVRFASGTAAIRAGTSASAVVAVAEFELATTEITVGQFREFIRANPSWAPSAVETLKANGLATSSYLSGFDAAADDDVLKNVSRPTADAYCAWLSSRAPAGYHFSIPTEAQWSYAASASGVSAARGAVLFSPAISGPAKPATLPSDAAGLKGMLGNVWEWCADSYAVNPASGIAARTHFPSPEGIVRGGSWANRDDLVNILSRGPMRISECSPYLGFRIALVPNAE
ncbi:MAG TPA: SUMF1/EgtB/PvdO family nonheme iron enzyme [bacterium]|nr:SUMF1/EgtB/PvdO family nonheme iron enzyme [bacterium]